jgi:hypothetical protein
MTNIRHDFAGSGVNVTGTARGVGVAIDTRLAKVSAAVFIAMPASPR